MAGPSAQTLEINGVAVLPGFLDAGAQRSLLDEVRAVVAAAPMRRYATPSGKQMSVRMSAAGQFGWTSGPGGYRYVPKQPDGQFWPPIPPSLLKVWDAVSGSAHAPDSCLVNFYNPEARMALHQDRDEAELTHPVVSVSLGDDGLFRVGGLKRSDPTRSVWLRSGDVAVLAGPARLAYHGVDRIKAGTSTLLDVPGRLNLTLRIAG